MTKVRAVVAAAAMMLVLAACGTSPDHVAETGGSGSSTSAGSSSSSGAVKVPTNITFQVGLNDPAKQNIAVLAYMPAQVTVAVGTPVDFSWTGTIEPHSVTFLAPGQTLPAPGSDPSLFAPTPATGPIDGTAFVNSGLQPLGPGAVAPMEVTFAKTGTFPFHCVIHPGMNGTVNVVDKGASGVDTPASVAEAGAADQATFLAEGQKAEAEFAKQAPSSTKAADGSTTWKLHMGTSTEHTDILEFQPVPATVKAGDTVNFVNDSAAPHTASFFGATIPITNPTDPKVDPPSGVPPLALDITGFFNSGLIPPNAPPGAGPPEAARSFAFIVPKAGTYSYVCILHASSGMTGSIAAS
jgi:plastocyanin